MMSVAPGCRWRGGHALSSDRELSIEERTHGPADHARAAEIEDCDQLKPALAREDAGGIGRPDSLSAAFFARAKELLQRGRKFSEGMGNGLRLRD